MSEARHIESPVEGVNALQNYFLDNGFGNVPDELKDKFKEFIAPGNSPVVASANAAELIYARREDLPVELLEIGAQLAMMCGAFNFHGLGAESRGAQMAMTIRSMDAVPTEAPPAVISPPEPKAEYVPAGEGVQAEAPALPEPVKKGTEA